ncbi:MAG TPA: hypothetical protein VFF98_07380 [Novosphingobium sp.]|nr:hypothetical protein [Novosphingobium sp.]
MPAAQAAGGGVSWMWVMKPWAALVVLQDQSQLFDLLGEGLCYGVLAAGWLLGARWRWRQAGPALVLGLLFLVLPHRIAGSAGVDTRFLPLALGLALATQDWSAARPAIARVVLAGGLLLLLARLAVLGAGFAAYARSYDANLAALAQVPLAGMDYLWLVDTGAPAQPVPGLQPVWQQGRSSLYRLRR